MSEQELFEEIKLNIAKAIYTYNAPIGKEMTAEEYSKEIENEVMNKYKREAWFYAVVNRASHIIFTLIHGTIKNDIANDKHE